jgi:hypothetical protein
LAAPSGCLPFYSLLQGQLESVNKITVLSQYHLGKTFSKHLDKLEEAYLLSLFWTSFDIYLSESSNSKSDALPLLPVYECRFDAISSLMLASYGRYKPSLSLLRSIMELSFLAVHLKHKPIDVSKAEDGDLRWSQIRDHVLKLPKSLAYVQDFNSKNMNSLAKWLTKGNVKDIYRSLSFAVHSRIDTWDAVTVELGEGPTYSYSKFHYWFRHFKKVHQLSFLLLLLHFPGVVNFYKKPFYVDISMPDDWLGAIRPSQIKYLNAIS